MPWPTNGAINIISIIPFLYYLFKHVESIHHPTNKKPHEGEA